MSDSRRLDQLIEKNQEAIESRRQAEKAFAERESKYGQFFETAPVGIYEIDLHESRIISVNKAMCNYTGYTREEFLALEPFTLFVNNHANPAPLERRWANPDEKPLWSEHRLKGRNGHDLWVLADASYAYEDGKPARVTIVARDITERKRLEEQLRQSQKMEAIGTLAGGIAHDLNNILGIILGNTELALFDVQDGTQVSTNLKEALSAGERAKDLIRQILTLSRKSEAERKPILMDSIVKEALKLLHSTFPATIEIRTKIETESCKVLADSTQIHQVLMNLCTNAAHAMRAQGGVLEVRLEETTLGADDALRNDDLPPGDYAILTVSDTGEGMTQEIVGKIFDPYFTTKEKDLGTGMGLSVVHGIIRKHGGAIHVHTELGKGTTFEILFPKVEREMTTDDEDLDQLPMGNETVLFVDDEKSLVRIGEQMLGRLGYEVVAKTNSIEALSAFRAQPQTFDLVILDQVMPNIPGLQLAKELLRIRPDVPIIICTGYSELVSPDTAKAMGIQECLMKPLVIRELAEAVKKVLDQPRGPFQDIVDKSFLQNARNPAHSDIGP